MKKDKKAHGVQLLIRCVVRDPDGKIITDTGRKRSKSFLLQCLRFIYPLFDGLASYTAKTTAGDYTNIYYGTYALSWFLRLVAGVNNSAYGLVVGTGDTAETNTDYKLQTQLTEGTGAGNITHGVVTVGAPAVVGANVDLEILREFANNTGSTITVKEAGLYVTSALVPTRMHCIVRDVLPAPVEVPDKCSVTVYYTMRTTV